MKGAREFPYDRASITAARRYVSDMLDDLYPEQAFDVELMTSELATNSINHTGTGFTVEVDVGADEVYVEVTDAGPGQPRLRLPRPSDATGRGLYIVDALASKWGVRDFDGVSGKTVWFTYRRPSAADQPPGLRQEEGDRRGSDHQLADDASHRRARSGGEPTGLACFRRRWELLGA